eukprot:CAMPEP_0172324554 /NCGR_PEP_ID=MMETSP1058-20130122/51645_1 /TAXON_ID=83371 /ORGANISM="Detonula confervacea, Strain CCMP 353" /LENGTH=576 /DNA_ID=CAMNT_0013040857 /DNA_START=150 /DNA_END=1877 /DNA_ORIENTATION=-
MPDLSSVYLAIIATSFFVNNYYNPPLVCTAQLLPDDPTYADFYCGWDWEEANAKCEYHCPSGLDSDCPLLSNGRKRRCIAAAGCFSRFQKVYWTGYIHLSFDKEQHLANTNNAVTNEEVPAEAGPPALDLMTEEETEAFESSFQDYLFEALKEQIQISAVTVQEQEYNRPCVAAAIEADDPTSTALDMEIRILGEYIPIDGSFTDDQFGEEILNSVWADPESFVNAIKNASSFFEALTGISAIEEDSLVESPSSSPSESPTRSYDQTLDIRIDPRPTGSYGIVFNVKTPPGGNSILLTSMSFVTLHEGKLEYEIYSKLGPFERFVGRTNMFDLVASGQTTGMGPKAYTRALEEDTVVNGVQYVGFKPVHVLGDRGQRSFYISMTKTFLADDGSPIPILFSYPISGTEGEREYEVVASNEELEVYEGDGVLEYPWPKEKDGIYYRRPRGFIGSFDYDRSPCLPNTNFTGWPCPYVPQTRPTKIPTKNPTNAPRKNPTTKPTMQPSEADTNSDSGPEAKTNNNADPEAETNNNSGPEAETNNNSTLKVGVGEKEISNAVTGSWKITNKSYCCGLALLM